MQLVAGQEEASALVKDSLETKILSNFAISGFGHLGMELVASMATTNGSTWR